MYRVVSCVAGKGCLLKCWQFAKMLMFTLAISCLTASNWPWLVDLTFQVPVQYCSLQASDFTFTTKHIHSWVLFLLWLSLFIPSVAICLLFSSSILDTYWPWEFIFQYRIILSFHTVHGGLKARMLKWFAIPFSRGPHFVKTLHHDPSVLGGPIGHNVQFIDKAIIHVVLFSVIMVLILSALWWMRIRGLWMPLVGRDWLWGKPGLAQVGKVMLSKSLIQFSADGWGCVPSL